MFLYLLAVALQYILPVIVLLSWAMLAHSLGEICLETMYWRDASLNALDFVLEGYISPYVLISNLNLIWNFMTNLNSF